MSVIGNPILLLNQSPSYVLEPFGTTSDDNFVKLIKAAHAGKVDLITDAGWAVGDKRTIPIKLFTGYNTAHPAQNIDIVLSSFDDYEHCGCVIQFDFANCIYDYGESMQVPASNAVGYGSSQMFFMTLRNLVKAFPAYLKQLLLPFSCKASAGDQSTTIETITDNYLALRSEIEIIGTNTHSANGEGSQLLYYTILSNRRKRAVDSNSIIRWWTRSPSLANSKQYVMVTANGDTTELNANSNLGLAPFGCI